MAAVWSSPAAAETFAELGHRAAPGAAAAPPVAGLVVPAAAAADDPAVRAFHVWYAARKAECAYCDTYEDWDDEVTRRLADEEWRAREALVTTIATTPAGIACQLRLAGDMFSDQSSSGGVDDLDAYQFNGWANDVEGKLLRAMMAGVERLAGRPA